MFMLVRLKILVEVKPQNFSEHEDQYIRNSILGRFVDKVVLNVGLFIAIHHIDSVEQPSIFPGSGSYFTHVEFTAVVFRPFIGELIEGRIKCINQNEIRLSIRFFEDIFIELPYSRGPTSSGPSIISGTLIYKDPKEGSNRKLAISEGDKCLVRVLKVKFNDVNLKLSKDKSISPLRVTATISEEGLGLVKSSG
ncbi:DNA-directed RNA polymerase III subunit rpc8 [Thelohanellus kitauei]|uniref:DNA-directed RNA polymerase III subunit rpc8 n=1 Tax=Thelohanellus kitauei TaxID=669202 RepID=A0A0C2M837_THEKT|nr:DNA-directed RNA polymerase III subunit rpc8 [Thelohanellus kitauei]